MQKITNLDKLFALMKLQDVSDSELSQDTIANIQAQLISNIDTKDSNKIFLEIEEKDIIRFVVRSVIDQIDSIKEYIK